MNGLYAMGVKWVLAAIYLGLSFLLILLFPTWLRLPLLAAGVLSFAWNYWSNETAVGRSMNLRPLTRWDVPGDPAFLDRLEEAARAAGLRRSPVWAVAEDEWLNAYAVGGRQGVVALTTALLKQLPPDELLAVVGHELQHLAARDGLPAMIGGGWMALIGSLSGLLRRTGCEGAVLASALAGLAALFLDLCLSVVGWVAEGFLAKRSRLEEHLADLAGARLTSASTMSTALARLEERHPSRGAGLPRWSAAWIARRLHASHPPTSDRIHFLRSAAERGEVRA